MNRRLGPTPFLVSLGLTAAFLVVPQAASATVTASASLTRGAGNELVLTVTNTGTEPITSVRYEEPQSAGYQFQLPATCVNDGGGGASDDGSEEPGAFLCGSTGAPLTVAPGASYPIKFSTSRRFQEGAGGAVTVTGSAGATATITFGGPGVPNFGGGGITHFFMFPVSTYYEALSFIAPAGRRFAITVERKGSGRRSHGKCVKRTGGNSSGRRCTLYTVVHGGRFTATAHLGTTIVYLQTQLGRKGIGTGYFRITAKAAGKAPAHAYYRADHSHDA